MLTEKMAAEEVGRSEPSPEEIEAYLRLSAEEIARLVLCLLIEEALKGQLAAFRLSAAHRPDASALSSS